MTYETLIVERDGPVLLIIVNRPKALNALSAQVLDELSRVLDEAAANREVRALVVTGAGDRAFVAGADISELSALTPESARAFALRGQGVFSKLETLGKPSIAAINGFALGGGCELAMACTLRLASSSAVLGQPEIDLGLLPGFGGTQRLPRLVGRGRALDLLLSGRRVDAAEAERIGLVNRVVSPEALLGEARELARSLADKAATAIRYILDAVHHGSDLSFAAASEIEASLFGVVASTPDMAEGTRAFLEKRKPRFNSGQGRS
jgi:enoyl-CoA hydratase